MPQRTLTQLSIALFSNFLPLCDFNRSDSSVESFIIRRESMLGRQFFSGLWGRYFVVRKFEINLINIKQMLLYTSVVR